MANHFNVFFTSIANEISATINPIDPVQDPPVCFREENLFNMSNVPLQQAELILAVNQLKDKCSLDPNNISMSLVKKIIHSIEAPLLHIFSRSLSAGIVPDKFKISKVIPVYKSGDSSDMNNYRPISLISNFCKILEKIVFNRLSSFLIEKNIITNDQFGFRKAHSTVHPMTQILNAAASALNNKKTHAYSFL